jgi:hypothetical protein
MPVRVNEFVPLDEPPAGEPPHGGTAADAAPQPAPSPAPRPAERSAAERAARWLEARAARVREC